MPISAAAAQSVQGRVNRVPAGLASLYSQRKYAVVTSVKLNTSGVSQAAYTGTIDAPTKPAPKSVPATRPVQARANAMEQTTDTASNSTFSSSMPPRPHNATNGAAMAG